MNAAAPQPAALDATRLLDVEFWRALVPGLSLHDRLSSVVAPRDLAAGEPDRLEARMREDGYVQDRDALLLDVAPALGDAVRRLRGAGLPPVFLFAYDEPWVCFFRLHTVVAQFLGTGYQILPDFWVWHVDPAAGEAGWKPHRDKGRLSLGADKRPLSLTVWIPLGEATPLNGCMYVLPASRDPVYDSDREDDVLRALDVANIRALPAKAGDFLCWNQAVLHWGARSSRFADAARISMAFEFQRGDIPPYNQPLIRPGANLSLSSRLKLVAKQVLQYEHMYPLSAPLRAVAETLLANPR